MKKTINERVFAGQVISWINEFVNAGKIRFEWATNDEGIGIESGPTVFPESKKRRGDTRPCRGQG
jgi:hypothetical protein